MRRFVPPPIKAFDPSSAAGDGHMFGPVRNAAYDVGFEAGRREGHAAGFAAGEAQARAIGDVEIARLHAMLDEQIACNSVADALTQLLAARHDDLRLIEQEMRSAVAAALDILFPSLMAQAAGAEITALIDQALTARAFEEIRVRASVETIAAVTARGLPEAGSTRLTLVSDADHPSGAADIAWTGGGLTFDPAALLRTVTDAISPDFT
jgi:flagellar biosynthesis/type III secretory pathway protein FliH